MTWECPVGENPATTARGFCSTAHPAPPGGFGQSLRWECPAVGRRGATRQQPISASAMLHSSRATSGTARLRQFGRERPSSTSALVTSEGLLPGLAANQTSREAPAGLPLQSAGQLARRWEIAARSGASPPRPKRLVRAFSRASKETRRGCRVTSSAAPDDEPLNPAPCRWAGRTGTARCRHSAFPAEPSARRRPRGPFGDGGLWAWF